MLEFVSKYGVLILEGTRDTLIMVFVSTFFAYVLGLPMGILLTVSKKGGLRPSPVFNAVFAAIINILRSLPFVILIIFMLPFTRSVVGTVIGVKGAVLPLVVAACAFVARMVETTLEEVDLGVVEAARAMGATNLQIIVRVLLAESVPSLLRGFSISSITILGYTAITGTLGAGGLGDIASRYGIHRYQPNVMYATIVVLIVIVAIIQGTVSYISKKIDKRNIQ